MATALVLLHSIFCKCCSTVLHSESLCSRQATRLWPLHVLQISLAINCIPLLEKACQDVTSIAEDELHLNVCCSLNNGFEVSTRLP